MPWLSYRKGAKVHRSPRTQSFGPPLVSSAFAVEQLEEATDTIIRIFKKKRQVRSVAVERFVSASLQGRRSGGDGSR